MLSLTYLGLIHKVNKDVPSLRKASLLFSVWLRQRGLGSELFQGGFGSFEAQALMAIMLNGDPENGIEAMFRTRYDHHQLFKATLILLVSRDFVKNPALYNFPMNGSVGQSNSQPLQSTREDIIDNAAALFFDGPRAHNILFKMSPWAYANLRRHAKITIHALNGTDQSRFEHCFISKLDNALTQYDQVMDVNLAELSMWSKAGTGTLDRTFNISNVLYQTLKRALTDRVQHIAFQCERTGDWETKIDRPKSKKSLQLNFIVDARQATRVQDLGPPAESKEAAASFRQFWGPKAELRRFRDGNIQETIVWNDGGVESIVTQIVRHTLSQHHGDGKAISIKEIGASFWTQLPQSKQSHTLTTFEEIQRTYHNLEQIIRGLKMPLTIRQISAASSGLRYSLLNIDSSLIHQPLYIVVQFESSGQWPDDLGAIQQVKIAFLQKLADLITQHTPAIRTRVGLNHQANNLFFRPFLEVLIGDFCFHILLYHDRELILLRSRPVNSLEERKLVVPEIHYHNTMLVRVPAHTSKIRDLCTQYPLLSQSIRLFKAWCSTHLLTSHFREELLEIFVVSTFTESAPCGVPSSLRTAFLRTISMLAKWDWRNEPLFVTMSEETDQGLIGQLNAHFEVWRKLDPSLSRIALIVGSTLDPTGTAWTEQGPSKMIAARLSALAKAAHSTIMKTDLKLNAISLFTHPTSDYDFVIHLNTKQRKFEGIDFSAMVKEYVEDLKRAFGDTLVWFHSGSSQKLIAGLWNPTVESKRWKVNLGYSTVPLSNDHSKDDGTERVEVRTNLEAILNEITRLGGDLVIGVILKNGKPYTDLDTNHSTKKLPAGGK